MSLKLLVGGVWAKVKKAIAGSDSTFEVSAARAVAGVRGTIFRVDATPLIAGTRPPKIRETVVRVAEGTGGGERPGEEVRPSRPRPGPGLEVPGPHRGHRRGVGEALRRAPGRPSGAITDTQFQTGKATETKDAIDRFLQKHP